MSAIADNMTEIDGQLYVVIQKVSRKTLFLLLFCLRWGSFFLLFRSTLHCN
jgi:hypothetical protein